MPLQLLYAVLVHTAQRVLMLLPCRICERTVHGSDTWRTGTNVLFMLLRVKHYSKQTNDVVNVTCLANAICPSNFKRQRYVHHVKLVVNASIANSSRKLATHATHKHKPRIAH